MDRGSDKPRIIVLGAGLAGLSVAHALLKKGRCRVTVLEREGHVGGMAASFQVGGLTTDLGPHRIYSTIPEMRRWFRDFIGDDLLRVRRASRMYAFGRYLQYPPRPLELSRAAGMREMARYAGGFARARFLGGPVPRGGSAESFGSTMAHSFGLPLCERLFFPYIRKVWKISPYEVSADVARARATMGGAGTMARRMLGRLRGKAEPEGSETTLQYFHYVRGGIGTLSRKLADEVRAMGGEILPGANVVRLEMGEGGRPAGIPALRAKGRSEIPSAKDSQPGSMPAGRSNGGRVTSVVFRAKGDTEQKREADFVFSTIPVPDLVGVLGEGGRVPDQMLEAARGLDFLNTILVYAIVRKERIGEDHWLYFPEAEPPISRAYEPRNFDPSLAPRDCTMLCMEGTALDGTAEWALTDAELARRFCDGIASTGLLRREEIEQTFVRRLEKAYPLYRLDYADRLGRIWEALRGIGNLIPLGRQGLFLHNNMDHSIHMGQRAAEIWSEGEGAVARWHAAMPGFRNLRIVD